MVWPRVGSGISELTKARELNGRAKERIGKATGDRKLQVEGVADQAGANMKRASERVKEAADMKQVGEKAKDVFKN